MWSYWPTATPAQQYAPVPTIYPYQTYISSPVGQYTVTASVEVNGQTIINPSQVESRLLGTYTSHPAGNVTAFPTVRPSSFFNTATYDTRFQPSYISNPIHNYVQDPLLVHSYPSTHEITLLPREYKQTRQPDISYPSTVMQPAQTGSADTIAATTAARQSSIQPEAHETEKKSRHEQTREEQERTEILWELKAELERDAQDHAAAMAQLRGARKERE